MKSSSQMERTACTLPTSLWRILINNRIKRVSKTPQQPTMFELTHLMLISVSHSSFVQTLTLLQELCKCLIRVMCSLQGNHAASWPHLDQQDPPNVIVPADKPGHFVQLSLHHDLSDSFQGLPPLSTFTAHTRGALPARQNLDS
jgi:hypothetical protein